VSDIYNESNIEDLLQWCEYNAMDWHRALTALVAERDALKQRVAEGGGMSEIVQRLRGWCPHDDECPRGLIDDAADEIERLRAELDAAHKAMMEGDLVAMLRAYEALKGCQ
jgi:hypothetical protein